jgi:hypothetical protein
MVKQGKLCPGGRVLLKIYEVQSMSRRTPFVLCCATAALLFAQSPNWKQDKRNDKGNRWEGLVGQEQEGEEWQLRSFTAFVERYPLDRTANLAVRYFVPDTTKAFVQAQEISDFWHYLMEPKPAFLTNTPGWRHFEGWRTDLLMENKIASENLGLLVRLGDPGSGNSRLAAAIVSSGSAPGPISSYHLVFYTKNEVAKGQFTVKAKGYQKPFAQPPGGPRGEVPLDFAASGLPEGDVSVVVNAPFKGVPGTDAVRFQVDFYHTLTAPR